MKKLSKVLAIILTLAIALSICPAAFAAGPDVTASAAVVMDYDTGEIIFAKDPDTMRVPASMTKIMTAYIIYEELEAGNITKDTQFKISDSVRQKSRDNYNYPTSVPLVGDTIDVDTLLKLIMLPSASASCICAAENISGDEAAFVARMNETAKRLGMRAEYTNCHGAFVHYISCRSIAILIRDFIQRYPDILNYTSMKSCRYNGKTYANTNKLLSTYYYEGVDGFKTGTIRAAGYCLSATAVRGGRRIISVVMNAKDTAARHTDSQKLLDYGFAEIARRDAAKKDTVIQLSAQPLKIGASVNVYGTFSGTGSVYESEFTLKIDGKAVGTYAGKVWDGAKIAIPVTLDDSYLGRTSAQASISFKMPDGTEKAFDAVLDIDGSKPAAFSDIAYHWAEDDITVLKDAKVVNGNPDGTFAPANYIKRSEFSQIIYNAFKNELDKIEILTDRDFDDIGGHWAEEPIIYLSRRGIIEGWDGSFKPDDYISREAALAILARVIAPEAAESDLPFKDNGSISDWAEGSIAALYGLGVINGNPDGTLHPLDNISRAEAAAIINRALNI